MHAQPCSSMQMIRTGEAMASYGLQSWDPYRIPVAGGPGLILGLRAWRLVPKGGIFYALTATVPWTDDRIRFDAALLMEESGSGLRARPSWHGAVAVAVPVARGAPQLYRLVPSQPPVFSCVPSLLILPLPDALLFCFF
jgi:hypothetical protein